MDGLVDLSRGACNVVFGRALVKGRMLSSSGPSSKSTMERM